MTTTIQGFPSESLRWLIGVEDTCVYPAAGASMGALDEYALTGHTEHWRADLTAAATMGATGLRYGVNWPLVHVAPGEFDWSVLDERLDFAVHELGLVVIADLVHYGTPTWLVGSFADDDYPAVVAEFAGAFAERYRGVVDHITPLNEPLTTASFCGLRGVWPPALTGWAGWSTVAIGIARGVQRSIATIRAANSNAVIVHVEASTIYETVDDELVGEVDLLRSLSTLPTDLILGLVDDAHPLRAWLLDNGVAAVHLDELAQASPTIDLMGVNYYPDLTPRILDRADGSVRQVTANRWDEGLDAVLREWHAHYGLPILVTETSIEGTEQVRRDWLEASMATVRALHSDGIDVRGLTWWPLLDFVDWSFASNGRNVEEFVLNPESSSDATAETYAETGRGLTPFFRRMGLISLAESDEGELLRINTDAVAHFPKAGS